MEDKSAAAWNAIRLDDKYWRALVQVRVIQNKEPEHFLLLFWGKMVVYSGHAGKRGDSAKVTRLFHVRGTNFVNCHAVQVKEVASSLSSNDCFILELPDRVYMWYGRVSENIGLARPKLKLFGAGLQW